MKTNMFGIYDTKACLYGPPFFAPTVGAAVRSFSDLANDKQSSINKHPSDYVLFQLGVFDDNDGSVVSCSPARNLGLASDYIEKVKSEGIDQFMLPLDSSAKRVLSNEEKVVKLREMGIPEDEIQADLKKAKNSKVEVVK